jgi:hypothetical protein
MKLFLLVTFVIGTVGKVDLAALLTHPFYSSPLPHPSYPSCSPGTFCSCGTSHPTTPSTSRINLTSWIEKVGLATPLTSSHHRRLVYVACTSILLSSSLYFVCVRSLACLLALALMCLSLNLSCCQLCCPRDQNRVHIALPIECTYLKWRSPREIIMFMDFLSLLSVPCSKTSQLDLSSTARP